MSFLLVRWRRFLPRRNSPSCAVLNSWRHKIHKPELHFTSHTSVFQPADYNPKAPSCFPWLPNLEGPNKGLLDFSEEEEGEGVEPTGDDPAATESLDIVDLVEEKKDEGVG